MIRRIKDKLKIRNRLTINKDKIFNSKVKENKPQMKGVIIKVYTKTPKKPNSALRKVGLIRINNNNIKNRVNKIKNKEIEAYIPGENHKLTNNNVILLIPKGKKDLPGIKYRILKGVLDYK